MTALVQREGAGTPKRASPLKAPLSVALVNNMPDAALVATERQFLHLIASSDPGRAVRCQVYYLPEVPRGEAGVNYCRSHYLPIDNLFRRTFDILVVTGCEPRSGSLTEEPFWYTFTRLVDWARTNTRSALWSCLAAHAAVLHLDGIERHRFPRKLSGVFTCSIVADHPLLTGIGHPIEVPHSRHNDLRERDLVDAGYRILTQGERVGVDSFVKTMPSLFVFFQGHPEYRGDSLGREFRRDVERYYAGTASHFPELPQGYFDDEVARRLVPRQFAGHDRSPDELRAFRSVFGSLTLPSARWATDAMRMYRNWFQTVDRVVAASAATLSRERGA